MIELIPGLQGLLNYFSGERHRLKEQEQWQKEREDKEREFQDSALTAIYTAAFETKIYLEEQEQTRGRNRYTEKELVRLWAKAAVPVRRFNADLADRCLLKADSWVNPQNWTEEEISANRIGIFQVWEDARKMLKQEG